MFSLNLGGGYDFIENGGSGVVDYVENMGVWIDYIGNVVVGIMITLQIGGGGGGTWCVCGGGGSYDYLAN